MFSLLRELLERATHYLKPRLANTLRRILHVSGAGTRHERRVTIYPRMNTVVATPANSDPFAASRVATYSTTGCRSSNYRRHLADFIWLIVVRVGSQLNDRSLFNSALEEVPSSPPRRGRKTALIPSGTIRPGTRLQCPEAALQRRLPDIRADVAD
jgi:hypothetical protein